MFDEHGTDWLCEPHTFVLERDSDGAAVRQVFTPDFYLLDLDLYIECTVMRPTPTTRKRQRVRKTREHEGVTVEILYGRDPPTARGPLVVGRAGSGGPPARPAPGV